MHERSIEFRMREFDIPSDSPIAGRTLHDAKVREASGALVLALRSSDGVFTTNPTDDTMLRPRDVIIAIGTIEDFARLAQAIRPIA